MAGPQDRDREPSSEKKFDAVWGELLGDEPGEAPPAGSDRTKAWDDSARAPVVPGPDAETDEGEQPPAGTRLGHAGQLAKEAQEAAAAREMERLMEGAAAQAKAASALRLVTRDDAAAQDDAEEGAKEVERAEETPRAEDPRAEEHPRAEERPRARAPMAEAPREDGGNKMLVGLVALAIAVGVGWMIVREPAPSRTPPSLSKPPPGAPIEPKPDTKPSAPPRDPPSTPIPAAGADDAREPRLDESGSTGTPEALGEIGESGDARPPALTPVTAVDPREPPPGTPEDIAAALRRLPVSAADRAPVGGVGAGGIHVDRIWMGSQYEDGDCTGASDRFSVSADPRPSVCVRVVHPREKEEVAVVWQKNGGAARRGKLTIKPTHAYRTRAYLVLRREDVGDWTVRILSQDGVELASHAFQVVE